ncbi:MAG: alpha/beta hydrolase [Myxococcota bacterium]
MGHIEILRDVPSNAEGVSRTLRIFTPSRYHQDPSARFGVVYMQDGQNVFAHPASACFPTWSANLTLERLIDEGRVSPWMIVAVDHGEGRFDDYSPWDDPRLKVRGRAERYARFLLDELKPWVDRTYRTRPEATATAVAGSSLGGLASLYLGWRHGDTFGRVGAFSPSVMWCNGELFRQWNARPLRFTRLYLDAGAKEHLHLDGEPMPYGEKVGEFHLHLRKLGYSEDELKLVLEPGGQHSEADWARRLPAALTWFLT